MTPTHIRLLAMSHPDIPIGFSDWLMDNFPIWERFEQEALLVARSGREHYSAYTIREFIRHETALSEANSEFKFNNNHTPHLARLFAMAHPQYAELFAFKPVRRVA